MTSRPLARSKLPVWLRMIFMPGLPAMASSKPFLRSIAGAAPGVPPNVLDEALLGPPLTFALALHEVWCLHASAVLKGGQAILFLGASGDGKSTLAAYLNEAAPGGWRRLADDILPCMLAGGLPFARPHFPQLKLSPEERYPPTADEAVPVGAVVVLRPTRESAEITLEPLVATAAVKALAEQTVAVSLFDRALHGAHLRFVAGLVQAVPVYRMRYPHDYARLPEVVGALEQLGKMEGKYPLFMVK